MKRPLNQSVAALILMVITLNTAGLTTALAAGESSPAIKIGTIAAHEVWRGSVYIVGDVTIPSTVSVTVEAGSTLYFSDYDILHSGSDKAKSEILAYGTFDMRSMPEKPIQIRSLEKRSFKTIDVDARTRILRFTPYEVETAGLRQEFHSFKVQYFVLWTLVYAMVILRR